MQPINLKADSSYRDVCWKDGQPGFGAVFHHFENKTSTVERPLSHRQIAEVVLEYGALGKHTSTGGWGSMDGTCHPAGPWLPSRKRPRNFEFLLPLSSVNGVDPGSVTHPHMCLGSAAPSLPCHHVLKNSSQHLKIRLYPTKRFWKNLAAFGSRFCWS